MNEREAIRKWMRDNPERAAALRKKFDEGSLTNSVEILESDTPVTMICGPDHGKIDGSKQAKCECGAVIWISPSTQALLAKRGATPTRLICMRCGGRALENEKAR